MRPRPIVPGKTYLLTRRAVQRQFLLRPDAVTNQIFEYCLAEAAERFRIELILPSAMSNHEHVVLRDRHGTIVEFMAHFHRLVARAVNAHRGRWENLWASEPPCLVELVTVDDVVDKVVYAATNPVLSHLVERVHHWPGYNGLAALLHGRPVTVRRPKVFFAEDGTMPEEVTYRLAFPPELGDAIELRERVRQRVAEVEDKVRSAREGRRVLGRRGVLRQSWRDRPDTAEPRRNLRPRLACRNQRARIDALQRDRAWQVAYADARAQLLAGGRPTFPAGTYWLRRFAAVPVHPFC